jgi:hypothetical protein
MVFVTMRIMYMDEVARIHISMLNTYLKIKVELNTCQLHMEAWCKH